MADSSAADLPIFNPNAVDLDSADPTDVICYLNQGENEYDGRLGVRVSAIFVILVLSTLTTMLPVLGARGNKAGSKLRWLRIPLYFYLFARYFGAGVIIATAFIHLLDPAYSEIGPSTCVGMTGGWAGYSWPPAIAMTSALLLFLLEFLSQQYVEAKFGPGSGGHHDTETIVTDSPQALRQDNGHQQADGAAAKKKLEQSASSEVASMSAASAQTEYEFREQIAAFLILEFGVIFHSVIIGLNLAVAGDEFNTLYPVVVFHQAFEGLGIGARLSAIPFPERFRGLPWLLCLVYGLTTPISIAIGLGVATTYNAGSFTANVVSGVLDATSAGILLYTGLVELLARDFLFNPERTRDKKRLMFMVVCLYLGAAIMALLGKWA
ncbi:hypothetical protein P8C59_001523 [Phyllachora maydis]|uniref:ZIP zinc/iron transport family n=1 Tax=Phyllachora maydis TaxID=1825666 RepID=A0AAD9M981_9PEZI|nr:hypothetical protein P8C59_001523 [Phyllachora maydis]